MPGADWLHHSHSQCARQCWPPSAGLPPLSLRVLGGSSTVQMLSEDLDPLQREEKGSGSSSHMAIDLCQQMTFRVAGGPYKRSMSPFWLYVLSEGSSALVFVLIAYISPGSRERWLL